VNIRGGVKGKGAGREVARRVSLQANFGSRGKDHY